jgi:hypothetical protein
VTNLAFPKSERLPDRVYQIDIRLTVAPVLQEIADQLEVISDQPAVEYNSQSSTQSKSQKLGMSFSLFSLWKIADSLKHNFNCAISKG